MDLVLIKGMCAIFAKEHGTCNGNIFKSIIRPSPNFYLHTDWVLSYKQYNYLDVKTVGFNILTRSSYNLQTISMQFQKLIGQKPSIILDYVLYIYGLTPKSIPPQISVSLSIFFPFFHLFNCIVILPRRKN